MVAWKDKFININKYSRSGKKLTGVKKLVVHYTANNGGTAMNHFNYFNNLKDRYASAHIFVDKNEALCIIPLNEVAYHAGDIQKRNADGTAWRGIKELLPSANNLSIGVEMCVEKDGTFHPDTIARTEDVFVDLCKKFNLDPINDIVRHFDITKKDCPAPWVKNGQLFVDFKNRVKAKMNPVLNGWVKKSDKWFYYGQKGWLSYKNAWYWIEENNQMAEGWKLINNIWYYLDPEQEGKLRTYWFKDSKNRWFYANDKGQMQVGWLDYKGKKYYLAANGEMVTGFYCIDGQWKFFNEDGDMATDVELAVKSVKVNSDGSISKIIN